MTTAIRTWADSDFYLSSAGTTNVREQIIKLQSIGKLVRTLSDASTVDTNGDKLQDRLLGLSLGDLNQRHKYRVLYDNANDRFLVQRNSGTDASKVWVELLRIDSNGNLTTTGSLSIASSATTSGGVELGGDLDVNDFYIRNAEDIFTQDMRVAGTLTLSNNHTPAWVYITSKTASSSPVIDFTGLTHYSKYKIEIEHMRASANGAIPLLQLSSNNGASFITSAVYASAGLVNSNFPGQEQVGTSLAAAWNLIGDGAFNQGSGAGSAITGTLYINSRGSASVQARARAHLEWVSTSDLFNSTSDIALFADPGATINAIRFVYFSGLITSGTFRLYGLRSS